MSGWAPRVECWTVGGGGVLEAPDATKWRGELVEEAGGGWRVRVEWRGEEPSPEGVMAAAWEFHPWQKSIYVLLPAGAYHGNRFPALRVPYSPRVPEELLRGPDTPPYITDVPRLGEGSPRLQLKTGDLAFPAFGWCDPTRGRAWFAWAQEPEAAANWVWEVEEVEGRAIFRVMAPGVRRSPVYRHPMMQRATPDRGRSLAPGESITLAVHAEEWPCASIPEFLRRVWDVWAALARRPGGPPAALPFHQAARLVMEHYERDCWREDLGLYASDCNPGAAYIFQTGWCGGMIATYPLLALGAPSIAARARRSLETFYREAPRPCGLFFGKRTAQGQWTSDFSLDAKRPYTHAWTLVRRQADALWYLLRQGELLERIEPDAALPEEWEEVLQRAARAFVEIWRRHGQFGHFVHQETGEVLVGGSTSGALVPAALAAAWRRWKEPAFLEVAEAAGRHFAGGFLARGFTTGGPGDALQNPDSESAAALLESCVELHRATGSPLWLEHGLDAAALLATWVMPYDFPFPAGTEFHRLGVRTRGAVFANTQNKHAAPGICTHAGGGLLALYRATREPKALELLQAIARFLPQCLSTPERPILAQDGRPLPSGWINERVNTSDWDENVGGVFYGSCWCEVAMLLTALELPGVYADPKKRTLAVLDHVEARWLGHQLALRNPCPTPAQVLIFWEQNQPDDPFWFLQAPQVHLEPGSEAKLDPPIATM